MKPEDSKEFMDLIEEAAKIYEKDIIKEVHRIFNEKESKNYLIVSRTQYKNNKKYIEKELEKTKKKLLILNSSVYNKEIRKFKLQQIFSNEQ